MRVKNMLTLPILLFIVMGLYLGSGFVDAGLLGSGDSLYLSVIILQLLIFILPGIFYCRVKGEGYSVRLNLRPFAPRKLPFVAAAFFVMLIGTALIRLAFFTGGGYVARYTLYDAAITYGAGWDEPGFWYLVVTFAVIPAVAEEFLYRCVVIREYTDSCGELTAVIMSALAYAILPLRFSFFPEQLFCGLILGAVTVITRSSLCAIIMRLLFNLAGLVGDNTLRSIFEQSDGSALVAFALITLALVSLVLAVAEAERICKYYVYTAVEPPELPSPPARFADALFSPSFIACVALFVIAAIL